MTFSLFLMVFDTPARQVDETLRPDEYLKIKFKSDPFSRVSSKCVIGASLMSCCWLDSNSMFMKVNVISLAVVFFWYRSYSFLFNSS